MNKKLLAFLVLGLLFVSPPSYADDIRDLEIEGFSIGNSLLDYLSKEKITTEVKRTRYMYERFSHEFGEVYLANNNFETYDFISFMVKPNDKKFIIYAIRGAVTYIGNMDECYKQKDAIIEDFSENLKYAKKINKSFKHGVDITGRSTVDQTKFILKSGDQINVQCMDFEEDLRIKKNWSDGLDVIIQSKEVFKWLSNPIN